MEGAFVAPITYNGLPSHSILDYQISDTYEGMFNYQLSETLGSYEMQGLIPEATVTDLTPSFDLNNSSSNGLNLPAPSFAPDIANSRDLTIPSPAINFAISNSNGLSLPASSFDLNVTNSRDLGTVPTPSLNLGTANSRNTIVPTPSPTASVSARCKVNNAKPKFTYRKACRSGDALLCLPRHVRNIIYTYLLDDTPELRYIEVPDIRDPAFPLWAVGDRWYTEACELMIERATFTLSTDCAIFSLMVFFNEFKPEESYKKARVLEFTSLSLFEKGTFSANSTKLLQLCPNLKKVALLLDLGDLIWTFQRGGREIDMDAMSAKFDVEALTCLGDIETVVLQLHPSMSLKKRLMRMEAERLEAIYRTGADFPGEDSIWGLREWLVVKALDQMRSLTVVYQSPFET